MENKKWSREEAEKNKNKLLEELKKDPQNGWTNVFRSEEDFEIISKELDRLIDEEEIRQKSK